MTPLPAPCYLTSSGVDPITGLTPHDEAGERIATVATVDLRPGDRVRLSHLGLLEVLEVRTDVDDPLRLHVDLDTGDDDVPVLTTSRDASHVWTVVR